MGWRPTTSSPATSTAAKASGWKVTIVSSDKDLMQLIEDGRVDMLDTMNDRRIGRDYVREKFGVAAGKVWGRAGADGRQRRQCPGVPGSGRRPPRS
jgi:DNA polymerase I